MQQQTEDGELTCIKCIHGAAPSYLTNLCVPVATNYTSRRHLRSATHGDLQVPRTRTVTYGPRSYLYYLEHFALDFTCIDHYTWTVSEWTKNNAVSFGLWDMTKRFREGVRLAPYKLSYLLTYLLIKSK